MRKTVRNADKILFAYSSRATTIYDSFILMITTIDGIWTKEEKKSLMKYSRLNFWLDILFSLAILVPLCFLFSFMSGREFSEVREKE